MGRGLRRYDNISTHLTEISTTIKIFNRILLHNYSYNSQTNFLAWLSVILSSTEVFMTANQLVQVRFGTLLLYDLPRARTFVKFSKYYQICYLVLHANLYASGIVPRLLDLVFL